MPIEIEKKKLEETLRGNLISAYRDYAMGFGDENAQKILKKM